MKKSQITPYLIVGLVIITLVLVVIFATRKQFSYDPNVNFAASDSTSAINYLDYCIDEGVTVANTLYGINEYSEAEYEQYLSQYIKDCMRTYVETLKEQGVEVKGIDYLFAEREIHENILSITIVTPITIQSGSNSFSIQDYEKDYERIDWRKLSFIAGEQMWSTDMMFFVEIPESAIMYNYVAQYDGDVSIRVADKSELNGDELVGNLIYGVMPTQSFLTEPMKVYLSLDSLPEGTASGDLQLVMYNYISEEWLYLPTTIEENYFTAEVEDTSYFGVAKPPKPVSNPPPPCQSPPESGGVGNTQPPPSGSPPTGSSNPPVPIDYDSPTFFGDDVQGIFEEAKAWVSAESGVDLSSYQLTVANECDKWISCIDAAGNSYCATGHTSSPSGCKGLSECGLGVHCRPDKMSPLIASNNVEELSKIFKHELTHAVQQINNCVTHTYGHPHWREWGAEFIAVSDWYTFNLDGASVTGGDEVGGVFEQEGCSVEDIKKAAFCTPGQDDDVKERCFYEKSHTLTY